MENVISGPFKINTGLDDIDVSLSLVDELLELGLVSRKSKVVEITEQYIVVDGEFTPAIQDYLLGKGYSAESVGDNYSFSGVTNEVKSHAGVAPMLGNNIHRPALDPTNESGQQLKDKTDYKDGAMVTPEPALVSDIEDNTPNTESVLDGVVNQPIVLKRKLYRKNVSNRKSYALEAYDITILDGENTKETVAEVFEYAAKILGCSVGDLARIIPSFDYGKDRQDILEDPTAWGGFDYQYFDNLKITSKKIIAKDIELDREDVKVGLYKMEGTPVVLFSFFGGSCIAIAKKNTFRKLGDHEDSLDKIMTFSNTKNKVNKNNKMRIKRKFRKNYAKEETLAVIREDSMVDWDLAEDDAVLDQFFVVCDYICDLLGIERTSSDSMEDELITVRLASNQNKVSTLKGDIEFGKQYEHYKDNFNFKVIKHNKVNFPRLVKEAPSRINYEYADYVTVNGISMVLMGYREKGVKLVDAYMSGNDDSANLVMLEWFDEEDYINGTYEYSGKRKVRSRRNYAAETLAVVPEFYFIDWDLSDEDELIDEVYGLENYIRGFFGMKQVQDDTMTEGIGAYRLVSNQNKVSTLKGDIEFGKKYEHYKDNFKFKVVKHDTKVDLRRILFDGETKVKYEYADYVTVDGVPMVLMGYKEKGEKLVDAFMPIDYANENLDVIQWFDEEDYINGTYDYSKKRKVKKYATSRREAPVETGRPLAVSPSLYLCDWDGGDDDELTDRFLALEEYIRAKLGAKPWEQDQYNDPFLFVLLSYQNKVSELKERWDFGTEYSHFKDNFDFKLIKHDTNVGHNRLLYGETYKVKYDFADNVEVNGVPLLLLGYKFRGKKLVDAFLMKDFAEWNVDMADEYSNGDLFYYTDKTPPRDVPSRYESEGRKPYSNSYNKHMSRYSYMKKRRAYARRRANFALAAYDITAYLENDYNLAQFNEFAAAELNCGASDIVTIAPDFKYIKSGASNVDVEAWGSFSSDYKDNLKVAGSKDLKGYDNLDGVQKVESLKLEGTQAVMFHLVDSTVLVLANKRDLKLLGGTDEYDQGMEEFGDSRYEDYSATKVYSISKKQSQKLNNEIVRRLYNDNRFKKRVALRVYTKLKNK